MRGRRQFLLAASGVLAMRLGQAQTPSKVHRIGWLASGLRPDPSTPNVPYESFMREMQELGYVEGRNLKVDEKYAGGRSEQLAEHAAELVRIPVDIILATTTTSTAAAKKATQTIPIVMGSAANPIAAGLIGSLSQPGANVTGSTLETADTAAKRLTLLKEAVPRLRRVAALHPASLRSFGVVSQWIQDSQSAAQQLGVALTLVDLPIDDVATWDQVFQKIATDKLDGATVLETPTYLAYRDKLTALALRNRIATVFPFREQAEAGGLMAYGADLADLYRRAAHFVDRILKGAKPADLPVEQPTKFTLVVNLKTATALGITLPRSILVRADRLIE
jgi:putative tryptophan/tyrosine transport system substrate-binding protein